MRYFLLLSPLLPATGCVTDDDGPTYTLGNGPAAGDSNGNGDAGGGDTGRGDEGGGDVGWLSPVQTDCYASPDHVWLEQVPCGIAITEVDYDHCALTCPTGSCADGFDCTSVRFDTCQGSPCAAMCPATIDVCTPAADRCQRDAGCDESLGYYCAPPETGWACGMCVDDVPCNDDSECGGGSMICTDTALPNQCPTCGTAICRQGCTANGDCFTGQTCDGTHRCVPTACVDATDCPEHFDCPNGSCARRTCVSDADCGAPGVCVLSACYAGAGFCSLPVP